MHVVQRRGSGVSAYHQPATVEEALGRLADLGARGRVIAGGTDLLLELARGPRIDVAELVDVSRIAELHGISVDGEHLVIGAATTQNALLADERVVYHALPLAQALLELGAGQLRNRATVVGNVVTASPANDTLSALLALGADLEVRSASAPTRTVALEDFVTGFRAVDLAPGELVTALRVRVLGQRRGVFAKLGLRKAQAISVVHGSVVLGTDDGGTVIEARIALGSVAERVVRIAAAEEVLVGHRLEGRTFALAAAAARDAVAPIDDVRASAGYRSATVEVLVGRSLATLAAGEERARWPARPVLLRRVDQPERPLGAALDHHRGSPIEATVNGSAVALPGDPGQTLLDWLRDDVGLTGSKEGCAEGECGACTVLLDGQPVLSCLIPAPRAGGAEVITVEGLGGAHPVQGAFVAAGAAQCGFCTPGFVVAAAALVDGSAAEGAPLDADDVRQGLAGNLCRCTGYASIVAAVESAAAVSVARRGSAT